MLDCRKYLPQKLRYARHSFFRTNGVKIPHNNRR